MDTVFKFGLIVPAMRATGATIKLMERESLSTLMVMFTMENGRTIKQKGREPILTQTVPIMKVNGWMINSTDKAPKAGPMVLDTKVITKMVRKKDPVN